MKNIRLTGTGNQAPYGIGETIAVIPVRHYRKVLRAIDAWHNAPTATCANCGEKVHIYDIRNNADWAGYRRLANVCKCGGAK